MNELHLYIYDQIGNDYDAKGKLVKQGVLGSNIQKQLLKAPDAEKIILHINSPGGSVYEGNFIHNILDGWKQTSGGTIDAHIEFMCASIATRIAAVADHRYIARSGQWLVHEATNGIQGRADDLRGAAAELDLINASLVNDYKRLTKKNKSEIAALMAEDKPMSAADAIEWGFCDGYLDQIPGNLTQYSRAVALFTPIACGLSEAPTPKIYLDYLSTNLGYKRSEMPQIGYEVYDYFVQYFKAKYGPDAVSFGEISLKDMLPTQEEFNIEKITEKIYLGDWKYRSYILSKDNHLLDGHHDWAAGLESDPNAWVSYTKIDLPMADLITESNELKITQSESVRAHAKKQQSAMNKIQMSLRNAMAKTQRALNLESPMKPVAQLADNTLVQYDDLIVGGTVEKLAEDGVTASFLAPGAYTIEGVSVTLDAQGKVTEGDKSKEELEALKAKITELEGANAELTTANASLTASNTQLETTLTASAELHSQLQAKITAMASLTPASPEASAGPQATVKHVAKTGSENANLNAVAEQFNAKLKRNLAK